MGNLSGKYCSVFVNKKFLSDSKTLTNLMRILEKEGENLEIRVLVDARTEIYKRIAMVLRQQLQEIGIKIKAMVYEQRRG